MGIVIIITMMISVLKQRCVLGAGAFVIVTRIIFGVWRRRSANAKNLRSTLDNTSRADTHKRKTVVGTITVPILVTVTRLTRVWAKITNY